MSIYKSISLSLCCLTVLFACIAEGEQKEISEADLKIREMLGENSSTFRLWPETPPDEGNDVGDEELDPSFEDSQGRRISNVTDPTITIRRPHKADDETPAVLVSPGGAYNRLAFEEEGVEIVKWLNSLGITGVLLKYRVPRRENNFPKFHHALQDAQRAMGIIRRNAETWGIDAERIGVLGFSAGGHLSALLSNDGRERLYNPVDEADKENCNPNFAVLIYPAYLTQRSPLNEKEPFVVSEELSLDSPPPTFIAVSQMDGVKRGCMVYFRALTEAEVPAELHIYEKGWHGGGMRPYPFREWANSCERWMQDRNIIPR